MASYLKKSIFLSGTFIAFYIGAGFATMQEILQYEVSYGSKFWVVILVSALIYLYTNFSFALNAKQDRIEKGGDIYNVYCGKYIGNFYNLFSTIFCYMCFIVMCGGANSTATEQWGFADGVGAIILCSFTILTVILKLKGILNVLNFMGPITIVSILIIAMMTVLVSYDNISNQLELIDNGFYSITRVANNPIMSGLSYGGFVILWFAPFVSEVSFNNKIQNVLGGIFISSLAIFSVAFFSCVALISNIQDTYNVGIPALVLAKLVIPYYSTCFAFIIFIGIYTTAVPLLWNGVTGIVKIFNVSTCKLNYMLVSGGIIGCLVSQFVPYQNLLNILYGLNGYLGITLVFFMLIHDFKILRGCKNDWK